MPSLPSLLGPRACPYPHPAPALLAHSPHLWPLAPMEEQVKQQVRRYGLADSGEHVSPSKISHAKPISSDVSFSRFRIQAIAAGDLSFSKM